MRLPLFPACECPGWARGQSLLGLVTQLWGAGGPRRVAGAELPQYVGRHTPPESEQCGGSGARAPPEPRGPHSEAFSRTT